MTLGGQEEAHPLGPKPLPSLCSQSQAEASGDPDRKGSTFLYLASPCGFICILH